MASSTGTWDTRRFPLCAPWSGERGDEFGKRFLPSFLSGLMAKSDEFCTYEQHLSGECPGGIVPPTAAQLLANPLHVNLEHPHLGNAAEQRKSDAAFYSRDAAIISAFRAHMLNPLVAARIDDIRAKYRADDFGAGAPVLHPVVAAGAPPVYPATHPQNGQPLSRVDLQRYQSCGNSLARHVLQIIKEEAMPDPSSGITRMTLASKWANIKMSDVGITDTTPRDLSVLVTDLAAEAGYDEPAKVVKYLSLMTYPADIATKATQELHRCSEHLRHADGRPDFLKVSREMQELWTVCCQRRQVAYKPKVASRPQTLDGMALSDAELTLCPLALEDDEAVYQAAVLGGGGSSVAGEPMCWNCLGFGHRKNENGVLVCPSPRRARSIPDAVAVLSSKATQQNRGRPMSRGRGGDAGGRGGRGGAGRGRGSQRQPPQANALDDSNKAPANVDGEGNVFAMDGTLLGKIGEGSPANEEDMTPEEFEDASAERFEMGEFGSTTLGGNALFSEQKDEDESGDEGVPALVHDPSSGESNDEEKFSPTELRIARKLKPIPSKRDIDGFMGMTITRDQPTSPPCDTVGPAAGRSTSPSPDAINTAAGRVPLEKKTTPFGCFASVLLAVANASVALANAVNTNRRAVVIAATTLAQGADASPAGNSTACTIALNAFGVDSSVVTWDANIDSGCSVTASGRVALFPKKLITTWHPNIQVRSASLQKMTVLFQGCMVLVPHSVPNKKKNKKGLVVKDALCVPAMKNLTLVSPKQLFRCNNIRTYFNDENCLVMPNGTKISFDETNKSYILKILPLDQHTLDLGPDNVADFLSGDLPAEAFSLAPAEITAELIHRRCCHFSPDRISASHEHVAGLSPVPRHHCIHCVRGGMKAPPGRAPRRVPSDPSKKPKSEAFGDLVWADSCSLPPSEPHGYIGWCAFLDDATRSLDLYFFKNHTAEEMTRCLQQFLTDNAEYLPKVDGKPRIKCYGTDNGGEFFSSSAEDFLREIHTRHISMPSYNPWRNPSERSHGIVIRCIRIVHAESGANLCYWPFTARTAVLVHNALVTRSDRVVQPGTSPFFMKTGKHADLSRLRVMFCKMVCFVRDKKESLTKIDIPTVDAIYLGIDHQRGGYYAYVPSWRRFVTFEYDACQVYENEYPSFASEFGRRPSPDDPITPPSDAPAPAITNRAGNRARGTGRAAARAAAAAPAAVAPPVVAAAPAAAPAAAAPPVVAAAPAAAQNLITEEDSLYVSINDAYATVLDEVGSDAFLCLNLDALGALPPPPRATAEFDSRPDGPEWWTAAQTEYEKKMANDTFDLVDRPPKGCNVVKSKIVCTYKYDQLTGALRDEGGHYVRWVACGYSEKFGRDYWETYTATTKACGLRIFAALVAAFDLDTSHIDDVKFFTQTPLKERIYCEQMDGFVQGGYQADGRPKKVCLLKKGLEGLKQSGNNAQTQCTEHLTGPCQLTQLVSEPTIFYRTFKINGEKVFLALLVWIDDKWAAFSRGGYERILVPFLSIYNQRFKSTNSMGDVSRFIGIDITRNRAERTINLSQEKYINDMVRKFVEPEKLKAKASIVPATVSKSDPYHKLYDMSLDVSESDRINKPYLAAVASAMYASCITRGDCAYYTSFLSQFSKLPFSAAWDALEQLLLSMYATRKHALTYGGKEIKIPDAPTCSPPLNPSVIKKMYGLIIYSDASWKLNCTYAGFFILFCNGAIDWGSTKLKVMLSSTEGEVAAGSNATRRVVYVRHLLGEFFHLPKLPVTHIVDNSATPCLTERMGASRKSEHFRRWQQFMRYAVVHGYSFVHLCSTRDQLADGLTKVVGASQFVAMHNTMLNL